MLRFEHDDSIPPLPPYASVIAASHESCGRNKGKKFHTAKASGTQVLTKHGSVSAVHQALLLYRIFTHLHRKKCKISGQDTIYHLQTTVYSIISLLNSTFVPTVHITFSCIPPYCSINRHHLTQPQYLHRTWHRFFGHGDEGPFHCDDWCFVSGSYL